MPRAITIGISLTTVCYLMVNVAYITVLGKTGILASEAVAVVSVKNKLTSNFNPLTPVLALTGHGERWPLFCF